MMLIPHLHFCGDCKEAIELYEKAFDTKIEDMEIAEGGRVSHASMRIHGQLVYLNDHFGNADKSLDCAVHLIVTFTTPQELLACHSILEPGSTPVGIFVETPYSKLCGNFMDQFGVLWGFMADA